MKRSTLIFYITVLVLTFLFVQCKKKDECAVCGEVKAVVERDLIVNVDGAVTSEFVKTLKYKKMAILGETHYVQEHQVYVSALFDSLFPIGYDVFLVEGAAHAFDWMVSDYVNGLRQDIPDFIRYSDNHWIEKVRALNSSTQDSVALKFHLIDMNHDKSIFSLSIAEVQKEVELNTLFDGLKNIAFDSDFYKQELQSIHKALKENATKYVESWGIGWYNRIYEMVEVEIKSSAYRTTSYDYARDTLRESTMIKTINKRIADYPDSKIILNVGMWHAQKQSMLPPSGRETLGEYFADMYEGDMMSIAFIGMKGNRRKNTWQTEEYTFDFMESTDGDDLIHIIGETGITQLSYLLLTDAIFLNTIKATYTSDRTYNLIPVLQFDAFIIYPEITVLKSMNEFEY